MGSTSDLPIMEKAAKQLEELEVPFELIALSAHRTPEEVAQFAQEAESRGVRVVISAAGMAAHLPGIIAALTTLPVIGVPIRSSIEGVDALLSIVQMPPGVPVATVGINGAQNAALLACQILADANPSIASKMKEYRQGLKNKIRQANEELAQIKQFKYKTN